MQRRTTTSSGSSLSHASAWGLALAALVALTTGCRGARIARSADLAGSPSKDALLAAFVPLPLPLPRADEPEDPPPPAPEPAAEAPELPAPVDEPPADAGAGEPPVVAQPEPPPPAATPDAARALMEELAARQAKERQEAEFLVNSLLAGARAAREAGRLEDAERDLVRAQALAPTNRTVADELTFVRSLLGRRAATASGTLEDLVRKQQVLIDEQRTTAEKFAQLGRNQLAKSEFDAAIESFENALAIINASPYPIDWRDLRASSERDLARARKGRADTQRLDRRRATEASIGAMAAEEEKRLLEERARLETMMFSAIDHFERDEFDAAIDQAEAVLREQPDNLKARELVDVATSARHEKVASQHREREKRLFKEWRLDMASARNLEHKILRWPSQRFWDDITRARSSQRSAFAGPKTDPDAARLLAKLKTTSVNLAVEGRPFKEVVQTLQIQTGVNLLLDSRIADVGESSVTPINVEQIPLEQVLNIMKDTAEGLVWVVRGNVVLFTKKEFVKHDLALRTHSVADLTQGLTDFKPPRIDLVMSDQVNDEEQPLFGTEDEETIKPFGGASDLVELIKSAVGEPGAWDIEGAAISNQGESAIIVKHTVDVQEQVAKFLDDLRAFSGIVITVDTRFLTVTDNFLRDIGVDFRGLGGQTPGTLVNLDDVTNGLTNAASAGRDNGGPGLPAGAALNPSAGAYFNDGNDGDFRGRTEQIFERPLGTVLSSLGGASLGLAYLDDLQINAILRAVEKTQSGRTLTAPSITVYNTQRANLTVVNQLSYIQDFDVEVAQTSFIADPIIGVIQDGLTLDVRPTVSNDRKYITLELEPTVAKLVEPIPTFSTTLASSFSPVIIQLPELRMQRARTTVRIPDGGSIVIGGLKNINTVDRQSEVPVLGKIPVLGFLFSRKGRADEMSNLMIIVRARVTDLKEQEELLRGR